MKMTSSIIVDSPALPSVQAEFKDRAFLLPMGGKFEVYHNDDFTDDSSAIAIVIGYMHEPLTVNG